jgi:ribosome-associated protein
VRTGEATLSPQSNAAEAAAFPAGRDARPQRTADLTSEGLLGEVIASLEDDKAEEIVQIDLRGRSEIADFMVICSGRSTRQVAAISEKLCDRLKAAHDLICKVEGKETGDWVLIDAGDVIVHVFRPEVRDFYQLEKMWLPGLAAGPGRSVGGGGPS